MPDTERARDQIREIRRDIEQSEITGDAELLGRHLADEVVMMPANGPRLAGAREVTDFHREHFETYDIDVAFTIDEVTVLGDLAVERGTYKATLVPTGGGDPRDGAGDYLYVYERDSEGLWKIIRLSW